jgi:3',5'-cyclic AMP phosphodiesterase CpdA
MVNPKIEETGMQDKTIDRRGLLGCMAWVGTGALWTITGGVPGSRLIGTAEAAEPADGLSFVQISDSHIGFNKAANTDVTGTLRLALDRIEALRPKPAFMLHTGDISHLSKEEEFDTAQKLIGEAGLDVHYVPGEHDMLVDEGASYLARFGKGTRGAGWHSFDVAGVHFVGLVNVVALKAGGLGRLGAEQLEWLEDDLRARPASQPIVVFAHIPLWSIYPAWGWGTDDAAQALSYLRRFGSVTVLNGHIHQVMQKVEGNVTFHTALSTAFPQPRPGKAASPGPMTVPAEQLKELLGTEDVAFRGHKGSLAIVDRPLAS